MIWFAGLVAQEHVHASRSPTDEELEDWLASWQGSKSWGCQQHALGGMQSSRLRQCAELPHGRWIACSVCWPPAQA